MGILHQLRWIICDQLIWWTITVAPPDEAKQDLLVTLIPWLRRQVERSKADMKKGRPAKTSWPVP
jgi:hypothetical protein